MGWACDVRVLVVNESCLCTKAVIIGNETSQREQ